MKNEREELIAGLREIEQRHIEHIDRMLDASAARFEWDAERQAAERVVYLQQAAITISFRDFQGALSALSPPADEGVERVLDDLRNAIRPDCTLDERKAREALSSFNQGGKK